MLWELTSKPAGLIPGNTGTRWDGEQTTLGLGCSSSESDSLSFATVSFSTEKHRHESKQFDIVSCLYTTDAFT